MRLVPMLGSVGRQLIKAELTSPRLYKGGSAYVLAHPVVGYGGGRKAVALEGGEMNGIAFVHTKVYEPHESLGLGTQLARVALDDARARRLIVMPFCPFIADFIERHLDEYGDLVAPEMLTGERP
jgi:predicted GNAT family acetyltransferase